jgi:hypothetical protein
MYIPLNLPSSISASSSLLPSYFLARTNTLWSQCGFPVCPSRPLIYLHLHFCVFMCWVLLAKLTLVFRFSSTARILQSHEIQEISDDCQLAAPKFFTFLLHHTKVFVNKKGRKNTQRR